jgi:hypothetical protein
VNHAQDYEHQPDRQESLWEALGSHRVSTLPSDETPLESTRRVADPGRVGHGSVSARYLMICVALTPKDVESSESDLSDR